MKIYSEVQYILKEREQDKDILKIGIRKREDGSVILSSKAMYNRARYNRRYFKKLLIKAMITDLINIFIYFLTLPIIIFKSILGILAFILYSLGDIIDKLNNKISIN